MAELQVNVYNQHNQYNQYNQYHLYYLGPGFFVVCEGPTPAEITAAVNRLPALPSGQQPTFITNPDGFTSSTILGGFANRTEADTTAIALRMVFRLPHTAQQGGARGGSPNAYDPTATIWVLSANAGAACF